MEGTTRRVSGTHQQVKLTAAGQLDRYLLPATFRCKSEARDKVDRAAAAAAATQRAASRNADARNARPMRITRVRTYTRRR